MRVLLCAAALLCGCDMSKPGLQFMRPSYADAKYSYTRGCIGGWTIYHIDRGALWALDANGNPIPCKE